MRFPVPRFKIFLSFLDIQNVYKSIFMIPPKNRSGQLVFLNINFIFFDVYMVKFAGEKKFFPFDLIYRVIYSNKIEQQIIVW